MYYYRGKSLADLGSLTPHMQVLHWHEFYRNIAGVGIEEIQIPPRNGPSLIVVPWGMGPARIMEAWNANPIMGRYGAKCHATQNMGYINGIMQSMYPAGKGYAVWASATTDEGKLLDDGKSAGTVVAEEILLQLMWFATTGKIPDQPSVQVHCLTTRTGEHNPGFHHTVGWEHGVLKVRWASFNRKKPYTHRPVSL